MSIRSASPAALRQRGHAGSRAPGGWLAPADRPAGHAPVPGWRAPPRLHPGAARRLGLVGCASALFLAAAGATAQDAALTYQGRLSQAGQAADGVFDLRFTLFDAAAAGQPVAAPRDAGDVPVTGGLFAVTLDFGAAAFTGGERWLQIEVRPGASTGAFVTLTPRQRLTAAPYAVHSTTAASYSGPVTAAQLPANVALLDAASVAFTGAVLATNPAGRFTGAFSGNGGGLTNLHTTSTNFIFTLASDGTNAPETYALATTSHVAQAIAQATAPLAARAPTNTQQVWLAARTDGVPGTGTSIDPYDVSTVDKLDSFLMELFWLKPVSNLVVTFQPGVYYTRGSQYHDFGWKVYDGSRNVTLRGSGQGATTIYLTNDALHVADMVNCIMFGSPEQSGYGAWRVHNCRVEDLTLDIGTHVRRPGVKSDGVKMYGSGNTISRVTVKNVVGVWSAGMEGFGLSVNRVYTNLVAGGDDFDNAIEHCRVEGIHDYGGGVMLVCNRSRALYNFVDAGYVGPSDTRRTAGLSLYGDGNLALGNVVTNVWRGIHADNTVTSKRWSHNQLIGNSFWGYQAALTSVPTDPDARADYWLILGNLFHAPYPSSLWFWAQHQSQPSLKVQKHWSLLGNRFVGNPQNQRGLALLGAEAWNWTGNRFETTNCPTGLIGTDNYCGPTYIGTNAGQIFVYTNMLGGNFTNTVLYQPTLAGARLTNTTLLGVTTADSVRVTNLHSYGGLLGSYLGAGDGWLDSSGLTINTHRYSGVTFTDQSGNESATLYTHPLWEDPGSPGFTGTNGLLAIRTLNQLYHFPATNITQGDIWWLGLGGGHMTNAGFTVSGRGFIGDGSRLANVPLTALRMPPLTNEQTGVTLGGAFAGSFAGNGAALTNAFGARWFVTNATPTFDAPNGSLCTTTQGRFYVRSNGVWVLK